MRGDGEFSTRNYKIKDKKSTMYRLIGVPGCERNRRQTGRGRRANRSRPGTVVGDEAMPFQYGTSILELHITNLFVQSATLLVCFFIITRTSL